MKKCSECGSEKIIENANIWETDHNRDKPLTAAIDESPDALIFKERNYSTIKADVCADCGFVKMYATEPKVLWEAALRRGKN